MRSLRFGLLACSALICMAADDASAGGATESAPAASKSIVDPKYRVKKDPDWTANLITAHATKMKDKVTKTKVEGSDPEEFVETKTQVPDGVDTDKLFAFIELNGLGEKIKDLRTQSGNHGFAGRARMTCSNILRAAARARHGLFVPDAEAEGGKRWEAAPAEWLTAQKVEGDPTQNPDGTKIVKAKPPAAEAGAQESGGADAPAPESEDA